MKNKVVNPLGNYLISFGRNNFLKKFQFIGVQRRTPRNTGITNFFYDTSNQYYFGSGFPPLKLAMNMNWLVFVRVEHHY